MYILNGDEIAKRITEETKKEVAKLDKIGIIPKMLIIYNRQSELDSYIVEQEIKYAEMIGIDTTLHTVVSNSFKEMYIAIQQMIDSVNGVVIQLPPMEYLDLPSVLELIPQAKDIDGITPVSMGLHYLQTASIYPSTVRGIMTIFTENKYKLKDKNVIIIGKNNVNDNALYHCLYNKKAKVTLCHRDCVYNCNLANADYIINTAHIYNPITKDQVSQKTIIIDAGINYNYRKNKIYDSYTNDVKFKVAAMMPVNKGIFSLKVVSLMQNCVWATKLQNNLE